jgi:hypothetical protein
MILFLGLSLELSTTWRMSSVLIRVVLVVGAGSAFAEPEWSGLFGLFGIFFVFYEQFLMKLSIRRRAMVIFEGRRGRS